MWYVQLKGILEVDKGYYFLKVGEKKYHISSYDGGKPSEANKGEELSITGYVTDATLDERYKLMIYIFDQWVGDRPVEEVDLEVSAEPAEGGKVWIDDNESMTKAQITPESTHTINAEP